MCIVTLYLITHVLQVVVGSVNDWQKERQFQTLNDKKEERGVKVIRGGVETVIDIKQVAVGDIVLLEPGEIVPCDGVFLSGHNVKFLRGDAGNTPLQIKLNDLAELIAKLGSAAGLILFTALLIRFFVQLGTNEPVRTANQKGVAFVNIFIISVTLIVVAVPEGLPLAVTLALAFATKRMTYEKLLVRILRSCETMANASVVCTNKTGTLTQNVMTVVAGSVGVHAKFVRHLEANTTRTDANDPGVRKHVNDFSLDLSQLNSALSPQLQELFNEAIAVNSTAFQDKSPETGELIFVGSKTETALLQFAQELQWPDFRATRDDATVVQVIPFSSERKAMGVVVRTPRGNFRLYLKGASEILSKKCSQYVVVHKEGPGSRAPTEDIETSMIDEHANDNITRTTIFYANQMLRTIALCYRDLDSWPPRDAVHDEQNEASYDDLAQDLTLIGIVGIEDPLRPGVLEAVKNCQMAGVTVKLCTGDNVLTARSIATQCGIFSHGGIIMEGPVFRELSLEEKIEIVPRLQVLARSSPKDKEVLVETLKHIGEIVGVTGDGTNDGPALKTANVGFSMGIAGTEVAKEASDIILMDDNFASIVKAIMWGRCVNDAVRKFLQFQVSTNITAIVITFVSAVASVEESSVLSAVQLLWIHIIMDTFAALALATDPASESLLNRKPDKKTAPLFSTEMYKQILFQSTYQIIITLVFHFAGLEILGFGHSQDAKTVKNDLVLQTLVFNVFVFTQIFNSVNCRRLDRKLNIFEGILKNWYFIAIMLIEICFQVLIVNIGGAAFKVTPIGVREWGISLASGVVSMPLGAVVRLLPNNPFERLFKMLGLLPHPDVLPTTNPNPDTVEWNATTRVRDNLNTFATVRGGRIGSSSFVIKNRWARPSEEQVHPETLPNPMIGTINGTHSWTPPGFLPDPTHLDSSRSAVLWEGKTPLHPDTSAKDPPSERLGGDQRDRRSAFVTDVLTQPERQDQGGVSSRSRRRSAATRRSRSTSQSSIQHSYGESASSINSQLPSGHSHHSESYDQHLASLLRDLDLTGKVERLGKYPFESGSLADIYTATLKYSKDPVAVKIFRRIHYDPQTLQRTSTFLCEEAKTWSRLHHPNVLSFLGIAGNLGLSPAIVTPLCTAGPITTYIRQTQPGTKERFKMIIGVAKGLSCLHSKNILHGNLCTKKVLISGDAFPVISGYGIFKVLHHPHLFSPRFSSPELFSNDGASADRTKSGDVYAFAMVALEILSGLQPYHHLSNDYAVVKHVFQGGRPVRQQLDQTAVPKSMWKLLSSLWIENPKSRPEMAYVLQTLTQMEDAIDDELDCSSVESGKPKSGSENSSSSGEEASFEDPSLPDVNGQNLKGRVIQEGHFPFARGGNSNIYRGKFTRSDGRKIRVAIKMILFDDGSGQSDEALRRLKREAEIWAQLKHKHLVPFIGVCDDVAPWPVLVSPFYKLGHVGAFLGNNPAANRPNIVVGVTSGLEYLHANGIVHGDLKVSNVLVDKRGIPYICDFGISKILSRSGYTTSSVGTCPYMAPELFIVLDGTFDPEIRPSTTKSSDVYSFCSPGSRNSHFRASQGPADETIHKA
ncbi:Calcium-transporting ATPase [Mycena venus]|uniref:Calcium-transporting ATPase n=1 Tax=Mycena venus TaxID=2733690 RepID=A0A8H6Y6L3_9AGAR|nr:Calcium-transporting ATPase [Mycena venus]